MNLPLGFSELNDKKETIPKKKNIIKQKQDFRSKKVEQFLESLGNQDDENNLADFPPRPDVQQKPDILESGTYQSNELNQNHSLQQRRNAQNYIMGKIDKPSTNDVDEQDNEIDPEQYNIMPVKEYYDNYVPNNQYITNQQEVTGQKDMLIEKLNYMIHLLEEQQEEKTGHVTEELILYSFLGVFMIFVIDSFARASKYVR